MSEQGKMQLKATLEISAHDELYKLVDFLNKNLKEKNLIFGLAQKEDKMQVTIYET